MNDLRPLKPLLVTSKRIISTDIILKHFLASEQEAQPKKLIQNKRLSWQNLFLFFIGDKTVSDDKFVYSRSADPRCGWRAISEANARSNRQLLRKCCHLADLFVQEKKKMKTFLGGNAYLGSKNSFELFLFVEKNGNFQK